MTGVFVEKAIEVAENDRENIVFQHTKQYDSFMRDVQEIFDEIDTEGKDTISWSQLCECLSSPSTRAYFSNVGIDTSEAAFSSSSSARYHWMAKSTQKLSSMVASGYWVATQAALGLSSCS